jgi:phosphopantetheinyl transferase
MEDIVILRKGEFTLSDMYKELTYSEREVCMRITPHKRQLWLMGRIAAKKSITMHLGKGFKKTDIELLPQIGKRPSAFLKRTGKMDKLENIQFTISHSHELAASQTVIGPFRVGIDIERIREFKMETLIGFLDAYEQRMYMKNNVCSPFMATLLWCLKEAYLKAMGTGLRVHPRRIGIRMKSPNGQISILHDGKSVNVRVRWTRVDGIYILVSIIL